MKLGFRNYDLKPTNSHQIEGRPRMRRPSHRSFIRTTTVQVHASPTSIFVLFLDYGVFDYENEDDDEDEVVAACRARLICVH